MYTKVDSHRRESVDLDMKTMAEQIEHHAKMVAECLAFADAAYGVGDRLAGKSYADSAAFHQAKLDELGA
jgi:hypothetical protein